MKIEVKIKAIGELQSDLKKDGSGEKWYARDVVLVVNDNSMYPDEFITRVRGELAQNCMLKIGDEREADISFSTHMREGRIYQDTYLRNLCDSQKMF